MELLNTMQQIYKLPIFYVMGGPGLMRIPDVLGFSNWDAGSKPHWTSIDEAAWTWEVTWEVEFTR